VSFLLLAHRRKHGFYHIDRREEIRGKLVAHEQLSAFRLRKFFYGTK